MDPVTLAAALAAARKLTGGRRVTDMTEPWVMAHRGGGLNLAKDNALSSLEFAAQQGIGTGIGVDGGDVQSGADRSILCCHDDTMQRTLDATGLVALETRDSWAGRHLLSFPYPGTPTPEAPPTFQQWVAACKRLGVVFTPEVKDGTVTAAEMVRIIQSYGMTQATIFQSFQAADLSAAKTAGMKVCLLQSDNTHLASGAAVLTAVNGGPPDYVSFNFAATAFVNDAFLQPLIAAGVKLAPWTLQRRSEQAAVQARLAALGGTIAWSASNDPWYQARLSPVRTADQFAAGWDHGIIGADTRTPPVIVNGRLRCALSTFGQWALQGWGSKDTAQQSIQVSGTYVAMDSTTSRWFGIYFGATTDHSYFESAGNVVSMPGPGMYSCILRQNGSLEMFRRDSQTTVTTLQTLATTAISAPLTLSAGLTAGVAITALPVNALTTALAAGAQFSISTLPTPQIVTVATGGAAVGATSVPINSVTPTSAVASGASVPQTATVKVEFLAGNVVRATRVDTNQSIQATDATYRGGYWHLGKLGATGSVVEFHNITIVN